MMKFEWFDFTLKIQKFDDKIQGIIILK